MKTVIILVVTALLFPLMVEAEDADPAVIDMILNNIVQKVAAGRFYKVTIDSPMVRVEGPNPSIHPDTLKIYKIVADSILVNLLTLKEYQGMNGFEEFDIKTTLGFVVCIQQDISAVDPKFFVRVTGETEEYILSAMALWRQIMAYGHKADYKAEDDPWWPIR